MSVLANWIGARGNHAIQPNAINETRQFNDMSWRLFILDFFFCNHSNDIKGHHPYFYKFMISFSIKQAGGRDGFVGVTSSAHTGTTILKIPANQRRIP